MRGLDKNRQRNQTVSFLVSQEERQKIEGRIKASGLPKGEYFIRLLVHGKIVISVGKYESDRLSLEVKKLRERLDENGSKESVRDLLEECKALLDAMKQITQENKAIEK